MEQSISLRQAFWAPYKKVARFIGEQMNKFAAARAAASEQRLQVQAVETGARVVSGGPAPAPPPVRHLRFEGGVGTYTLDFGGLADREVDVDVTVGMGTLSIVIPTTVGARILYDENWMSSINLEAGWTTTAENEYSTENSLGGDA